MFITHIHSCCQVFEKGSPQTLLRPHVRGGVHSQAVRPRERLAARLADMRLLPRMRARVPGQAVGRGERLAARLADMRLLP